MPVERCMRTFLELKQKLDNVERHGADATTEDSYEKEFTKLRELSASYKTQNVYPSTEGERACNNPKNRYKDIVPFDYTRVKLNLRDGMTSDYINASYIRSAVGDQMYIAAQGPLPKTVNDFWQMLWENDVRVMFMACREYEGEPLKLKCQRYWPLSTTEEMTFGDIKVTLDKEETTTYKEHLIRHMVAKVGGEERKVIQLHYQDWPDRGSPRCIPGLLDLIETMRRIQPIDGKLTTPILVHCSAGCGRTGTILVIDYVQSLLKYGKLAEDFKLYNVIAEMRKQRMAIVQSLEQYIFVHDAIAELFTRQLQLICSTIYGNVDIKEVKKPPKPKLPSTSSPEVDYEDMESPLNDKEKPVKPPRPSLLPKPSEYAEPIKVTDSFTRSEGSQSSASSDSSGPAVYSMALPVNIAGPEYAVPYAIPTPSNHKPVGQASPKNKSNSAGELIPKSGSMKKPLPSLQKDVKNSHIANNEYAYADPYQADKWSLQALARGLTPKPESQYSFIDDSNPYAEVNVTDRDLEDEHAPKVPAKHFRPEEIGPQGMFMGSKQISKTASSPGPLYEVAQVIYKGVDISFPNRVGKPRGKRPNKMASSSPSAIVH